MKAQYAVVVEHSYGCWSAHVPDVHGCMATAGSREEVIELITRAMESHFQRLQEEGHRIPEPRSEIHSVQVHLPMSGTVEPDPAPRQSEYISHGAHREEPAHAAWQEQDAAIHGQREGGRLIRWRHSA